VEGDESEEEDQLVLKNLSNIKPNSLNECIDVPAVSRPIMRAFKDLLMTYVDKNGTSVYGQRIKKFGEDSKAISAYFLANCPTSILAHFDKVALDAILLY